MDSFDWDPGKAAANRFKHGVSFSAAQYAFQDPNRIIAVDLAHSTEQERRYYCFGQTSNGILTVRFTWRDRIIRIISAGYWRRGKRIYEQENQIHQ